MINLDKYLSSDLGINSKELYKIVSTHKNSVFVDLGVRAGISSEILLIDSEKNNNLVYGVDVDFSHLNPELNVNKNYFTILGDSTTIGKYWEKKVNVIFVDTFHIKEQVLCELYYWFPKIENDGFIVFHDSNWPEGKYDTYGGIVWDRVEEAIKYFFNVESLNYQDEYIDIQNFPESWGMTIVKLKKKKNYIENILDWSTIFEKRNKLISLFWNESNKNEIKIDLVINV